MRAAPVKQCRVREISIAWARSLVATGVGENPPLKYGLNDWYRTCNSPADISLDSRHFLRDSGHLVGSVRRLVVECALKRRIIAESSNSEVNGRHYEDKNS